MLRVQIFEHKKPQNKTIFVTKSEIRDEIFNSKFFSEKGRSVFQELGHLFVLVQLPEVDGHFAAGPGSRTGEDIPLFLFLVTVVTVVVVVIVVVVIAAVVVAVVVIVVA